MDNSGQIHRQCDSPVRTPTSCMTIPVRRDAGPSPLRDRCVHPTGQDGGARDQFDRLLHSPGASR
jgi:hypothetical protein